MKKRDPLLIVLVLLLTSLSITAQECNCLENYQSLLQMIRINYPGYQDKIAKAPHQFKRFSDSLYNEAQQQKDIYHCYLSLRSLIKYFKDPHLSLSINYNAATKNQIKSIFSTLPENNSTAGRPPYINKPSLPIEGLWELKGQGNYYRLHIRKNENGNFIGTVINADSVFWYPGQIKLIVKEAKGNYYKISYLVRDHTPTELAVYIDKDGLMNFGPYGLWQRVDKEGPIAKIDSIVRSKSRPSLTLLNNKTTYLRIPGFDINIKDTLASILESNQSSLQNQILVIDLRDNTGGSTLVSSLLLKYVYDGPILNAGSTFFTSSQNLEDVEKMYKRPEFVKIYNQGMRERIARLKDQPDTLAFFTDKKSTTLDTVYPSPKNVYIIANRATASTSEYFILQARQSKKVKIVGQYTRGAIDYTDISLPRTLPCPLFYYQTPMVRSNRVDYDKLDETGIKPDIIVPNDKDALSFIRKLIHE